jgi:DNA-binding NarL/FixJ family response regulator
MEGTGRTLVLVADGNDHDRRHAVRHLREAGYAVRGAVSGEDALRQAAAERPAAVVLEVRLPDLTGYEVCRRLRESLSAVPIVFVSRDRTEPSDMVAGLLVGADDYLAKPYVPDELLARVRAVVRRASTPGEQAPELADSGDLTRREQQVLRLLGEGLEPADIAERLVISPKTVAGHIEQILKKLDVHSRAAAVALAYRKGFVVP